MKVLWQGILLTDGRAPDPILCRIVEALDGYLDPTFKRGKGLRLEREEDGGLGKHWVPHSAHQVSAVSIVEALATARSPVAAVEVSGPQPSAGALDDCG